LGVPVALGIVLGLVVLIARPRGAHAEGAEADAAEQRERCAVRLSVALTGVSPEASLLASSNPQGEVDNLVNTPAFADRFARFINSEFNGGPALSATEDPVYFLAHYIVANRKPWSELFVGPYDVVPTGPSMTVQPSAQGLGFFRSLAWLKRYAGNEERGLMLAGAFRVLSNTTGLVLDPSSGNPGDDRTSEGRKAAACKGCHFDAWYALDKVATLLPRREGQDPTTFTFVRTKNPPQPLLGKQLSDDRDLLTTLVASEAWRFQQCRNVFRFLYGRTENQCEAPVFDACVDTLAANAPIQSAVAVVAKDPSFCMR